MAQAKKKIKIGSTVSKGKQQGVVTDRSPDGKTAMVTFGEGEDAAGEECKVSELKLRKVEAEEVDGDEIDKKNDEETEES